MRLGSLLLTAMAMSVVVHAEDRRAVELAQSGVPALTKPGVPTAPDNLIPKALQKQLDDVLATKDYMELTKALNQTPPVERLTWATSRLLAGKTAFLGYSVVRDLWSLAQVKDPQVKKMADTAVGVMALYVLEVILVDGAICEDISARGPQQLRYLTAFRPVFEHLKTLSVDEKKKIISAAILNEQKTRIARQGDDFLCRGGLGEFKASVEQLGPGVTVGELAAKYGEKSKSGLGTDVKLPAAKAYTPKFLPFEKYAPEQHKLRSEIVGTLIELLK
jgi:hypothetical protein